MTLTSPPPSSTDAACGTGCTCHLPADGSDLTKVLNSLIDGATLSEALEEHEPDLKNFIVTELISWVVPGTSEEDALNRFTSDPNSGTAPDVRFRGVEPA